MSKYICPNCEDETEATEEMVNYGGVPNCGNCDRDMELIEDEEVIDSYKNFLVDLKAVLDKYQASICLEYGYYDDHNMALEYAGIKYPFYSDEIHSEDIQLKIKTMEIDNE